MRLFSIQRASDRLITVTTCFYKASSSMVFVIWGLILFSSLLITPYDGFRDDSEIIFQCAESSDFVNKHQDAENNNDKVEVLTSSDSSVQLDYADGSADTDIRADDISGVKDLAYGEKLSADRALDSDALRTSGVSREPPRSLNDFKSTASNSKPKMGKEHLDSIRHRVEPSGKEYNYASASKGAKILAYNEESKGAKNILIKDKDKYLRNPCSVKDKFVVIELSEETLVDTIMLANFEHYSSNLKDFELLGSKGYPTEKWVKLGNFTAPSVKHEHRFTLQDPQWARYLKLKLLSHYGSEFYCTLSVVEVYGDDVMERMLEDLISQQSDIFEPVQSTNTQKPLVLNLVPDDGGFVQKPSSKEESDNSIDNPIPKADTQVSPDLTNAKRTQLNSRLPSDTILKIIMQKVRSFDINLSVLEKYLEELNSRYGNIFEDLDKEIENKAVLLKKIRSDFVSFHESRNLMAKELDNLISWKSVVSAQMDSVIRDNALLRVEVESDHRNQTWVENKCYVIFIICLIFGALAILRLLVDVIARVCNTCLRGVKGDVGCIKEEGYVRKFCHTSSFWLILLMNCAIVMFILSL